MIREVKNINVFVRLCRGLYRVVGFEVETSSILMDEISLSGKDATNNCELSQNPSGMRPQPATTDNNKELKIYFTYSVAWKRSDISWASRWDIYLAMTDVEIHWFSIINSIVVIFFLTGEFRLNVLCSERRDLRPYKKR